MEPKPHSHLREEEIERYSLSEMSEEELARWGEHLLICDSCRRQVAASDAYVAAMRSAAAELRRAPATPGRRH